MTYLHMLMIFIKHDISAYIDDTYLQDDTKEN